MISFFSKKTGSTSTDRGGDGKTARVTGHFGEILQGRLGSAGTIALATLPCPALQATAQFRPAKRSDLIISAAAAALGVAPIAERAARTALGRLGATEIGGRLLLRGEAPVGAGCGASTMAALAAARAVALALDAEFSAGDEVEICLAAEGASDPLMFENGGGLLFASQEGRILERMAAPPEFEVLGVFDGPGRPADPNKLNFADVSDLATKLAAAYATGDRAAVGEIATQSARRNGLARRLPRFEKVAELGAKYGAYGLAAAHTGSALALLFAPGAPGVHAAAAALRALGFAAPLAFSTAGALSGRRAGGRGR